MKYVGAIIIYLVVSNSESSACTPVPFNQSRYTSEISFTGKVRRIEKSVSFVDKGSKLPFVRAEVEILDIFKGKPAPIFIVKEYLDQKNSICPCSVGYLEEAYKSQRVLEFHLPTGNPEPFVCDFFSVM